MKRRDWIRNTTIAGTGLLFSRYLKASDLISFKTPSEFTKTDFGTSFKWGVAAASYQTEGAWNLDGKSESNWDHFSRIHGKIERGENADITSDFTTGMLKTLILLKQ